MRQNPPVGRHRGAHLRRHRAPALPALLATRGRTALSMTALGAGLAAGIGAAGVSATAAPAGSSFSPVGHVTAAHPYAAVPIPAPDGDEAPGKAFPHGLPEAAKAGGPAADVVRRKTRPVPVVAKPATVAAAAVPRDQWVDPLPTGGVTSCFGPRWGRLHAGVDLAAPHGTPIVAAGAGAVVTAGVEGGYGNAVLIDHGNGYLTHYGHLSAITVQVGQRVSTGEHIGDEGSTGHSTGPHLHFEVHEGHYQNPVEPTAWMRAHGVDISGCETPAQ